MGLNAKIHRKIEKNNRGNFRKQRMIYYGYIQRIYNKLRAGLYQGEESWDDPEETHANKFSQTWETNFENRK